MLETSFILMKSPQTHMHTLYSTQCTQCLAFSDNTHHLMHEYELDFKVKAREWKCVPPQMAIFPLMCVCASVCLSLYTLQHKTNSPHTEIDFSLTANTLDKTHRNLYTNVSSMGEIPSCV